MNDKRDRNGRQSEKASFDRGGYRTRIQNIIAKVGAVVTGPNPSLRGMASEYFVAPDDRGTRIEITAGTNEATTARARDFCRTRGWRYSVYARLQTIDGRNFLADVLCADAN